VTTHYTDDVSPPAEVGDEKRRIADRSRKLVRCSG